MSSSGSNNWKAVIQLKTGSKLTHSFDRRSVRLGLAPANQHPRNWSTQLTTHRLNAILHNPNHMLGYGISTAIVPWFQHNWLLPETRTPRQNPTFSAVGRCENISHVACEIEFGFQMACGCHLDNKFDFGWGSAMRELTALPTP